MIGDDSCRHSFIFLNGAALIWPFIDAECFFSDCLQSLRAVDIVGTDDDCPIILVEGHAVEINSYALEDGKIAETQEALSPCGEAILLPSAEFDGDWERSEDRSHLPLHS